VNQTYSQAIPWLLQAKKKIANCVTYWLSRRLGKSDTTHGEISAAKSASLPSQKKKKGGGKNWATIIFFATIFFLSLIRNKGTTKGRKEEKNNYS